MLVDDYILQEVKILLDIDFLDEKQENLLVILKRRAIAMIINYLNDYRLTTENVSEKYHDAVVELVIYLFKSKTNKDMSGVKQYKEGQLSITYQDTKENNNIIDIPQHITSMLPIPFISTPRSFSYE